MNYVEYIGYGASLFILTSLIFKQTSVKNRLLLRIFNCIGSIIFIIYGFLLPAYATAFFNILASIINIIYGINELKELRRKD